MVHWFLRTVPHTATIASSKRKLALHFACGDGHLEIAQVLLRAFPQGASMASAKGKLPLHFAARWGHLAIAREVIQVYPDGVRALDWEGSLPIHDCAREGQYDMTRLLVEHFPMGLLTANVRSEIPLFPAVRSGNMDLICYMVQTWPAGAQHVLKSAGPQDWDWESWDILELLLRGAVGNFANCHLLRGRLAPTIRCLQEAAIVDAAEMMSVADGTSANKLAYKLGNIPKLALKPFPLEQTACCGPPAFVASVTSGSVGLPNPDESTKKRRSSSLDPTDRKRSKHQWRLILHETRQFSAIHAALDCGASHHVVERILARDNDANLQLCQKDDTGRLPLHAAAARCTADDDDSELIELICKRLVCRDAAMTRDTQGNRLPLHIGLDSNAHVTLIERLLDVYPQSGTLVCGTKDEWEKEAPICRATNCSLSVVYRMLRVDPNVVVKLAMKQLVLPVCQDK